MLSSRKNPWRVVRGEEAGRVEAWCPPDLSDAKSPLQDDIFPEEVAETEVVDEPVQASVPTLEEIEEIQRQAHDEGYEQGRKEGFEFGHKEAFEEGRKQLAEKLLRLDGLLGMLDAPFKELDDQVEQELLTLVVAMVRQLVRREVRTDPNQIIGVMREAMAVLPVSSRNVRVLLHPDDAELVRELYTVAESEHAWQIVEDPVVQRGGCRVTSDTSQVDSTLESRLNNLIAPLIGGLRTEDQEGEGNGDG